jgi:signal peptidase I
MSVDAATGRKPWVAVVLSLLTTGLGQIYCGHIVRGLFLFLGSALFAPLAVWAALQEPVTSVLVQLLVMLLAVVAFYVFAVVDAFCLARRHRDSYVLRDYNRGLVYMLFILVGMTYPPVIVHYLRSSVFEGFLVPTASEAPNILPGDHVLVNKLVLQRRSVRRGDVIAFRTLQNRRLNWIKRVIALPGDTVAVRGQEVFINGKKLERERQPRFDLPALPDRIEGDTFVEVNHGSRYSILLGQAKEAVSDFAEKKVPEGACFVLGDNRANSTDSRQISFVPLGEIIGVFQYIYLPAESWERFGVVN